MCFHLCSVAKIVPFRTRIKDVFESGVLTSGERLNSEDMKLVEDVVKTMDMTVKMMREYGNSDRFQKKHKIGKYADEENERINKLLKKKKKKKNNQKEQPKTPSKIEL